MNDSVGNDHWKELDAMLQMGSSDEDSLGETAGEAHLLKQETQKAKPKKRQRKTTTASTTQKAAKAKQPTILQAISNTDIDRYFKEAHKDDDDNMDISKYLEEDSADDDDDDEENGAEDLIASLAAATAGPIALAPEPTAEPVKEEAVEKPSTRIKLEDETFDYGSENDNTKQKKRKREVTTDSGKSGYLAVEEEKKGVQLSEKFLREKNVKHESSTVPVAKMEDATSSAEDLFYWMDAKEQPYNLSVDPGSIFLFGKMATKENGKQQYKSCCLRVRNVERTVYLLKKKDSSEVDVVKEINDLCRKQSIEQRHIKFAERYYAFEEENIPQDKSLWAELRYPGRYPPFQVHASYNHIEAVVGSTYSLLELFLLNRKIMGPCYLRVAQKTMANIHVSHCELEYTVDSPAQIVVEPQSLQPPPVTVVSIQLHSQLDATGAQSEICVVSLAVYKGVQMDGTLKTVPDALHCGIRPLVDTSLPIDLEPFCEKKGLHGVQRFPNETQLLKWCANRLGAIDADILIGHNFLGFTVGTLIRRYQELNIPGWSTLGRLDLKRFPRMHGQGSSHEKEVCIGRLVADSYLLSREYYKSVNYKLVALAEQMGVRGLVEGKSDFEPGTSLITPVIQNFSKDLFDVLLQINNNAILSTGIVSHLDALRLTKRLTTIAGNLWSRSLYGGRSERIEYLLLHTFHDLGFVVPDKKAYGHAKNQDDDGDEGDEGKRKAKYKGGMVLDPKCGLYSDYILLLDFNSLYPSLIQEFNICFTTVDRRGDEEVSVPPPENLLCHACAAEGKDGPCVHKCILPKVIKSLVDSRRDVKRLMKTETDPNKLALLEIRQKSLKLTANSMYGCLGFEHSRFYAQALAELVTSQGREALQNTVSLIPQKKPSLRVIYGDTDSVMIQTSIMSDIKEVRDLGLELKGIINKQYKSLEIDIDGVFRAILLLKKKKYAALSVVDWQDEGKVIKKEIKGLDMVRRDWCPLSKKVCDAVLNRVLSAKGSEDILDYLINYMRDVADHVRLGDRYTLDDFVISKSLTKEPESYRGTAFPHAAVALRMRERKELVRVGDLIPYVICDGDKLADKAYHVDEVRQNKSLHIDSEWYLESQIYPPVMRLCEHIQGFSSAQLSEAMGVAYHHAGGAADQPAQRADDEVDDFSHCALFKNRSLEDCFPSALPFQVTCTHCHCKTPIDPHKRVEDYLATAPDPSAKFDLYTCGSCHRSLRIAYIANCFRQMCHGVWRQFYECGGTPSAVRALRVQFTYFRALFEVPHAPGCLAQVKWAHRGLARRCKGITGELLTLEESLHFVEAEAVDPLNEAAVAAYKRVENFFINLDDFF